MTERRSYGALGAEPVGKVKTAILIFIYGQNLAHPDKEFTREMIADSVVEASRNQLAKPIKQRQGIYRHLDQLHQSGLLTGENSDCWHYKAPPLSLESFRKICRFALDCNLFPWFAKSLYFQQSLPQFFPSLVREGFDLTLPTTYDSEQTKLLFEVIGQSPTAARMLILEPKKLQTIEQKVIGLKEGMVIRPNPETTSPEVTKFMEGFIPLLATCIYLDIFHELDQLPYENVKSGQYSEQFEALLKQRDNFAKLTGCDLHLDYFG